jgi:hypothetical protein
MRAQQRESTIRCSAAYRERKIDPTNRVLTARRTARKQNEHECAPDSESRSCRPPNSVVEHNFFHYLAFFFSFSAVLSPIVLVFILCFLR